MLEGELRDAFGDLFNTVGRDKLVPARLGVKRGGSVDITVPGYPKELYISLGINGEDGPGTALDGVGVDIAVGWQEIRVRRELNKWVIYRAAHYGAGSVGGGATTLDALTDVDTAGVADGDLLSYDSTTGEWIPFTPTGTTGEAPSPHALFGEHHTSAPLDDSQGPNFLLKDGSRPLEGNLTVLPTVTIDGIDISDHAGDEDAHHDHATAGNAGITVSASPTQLISLNLLPTTSGLQIDPTGVRVKNYHGIERTANGIGILIKSGVTALKVDATGLYLDDALAGTGLSINTTTKVMSVKVGEGLQLDVPNDEVEVNKGHNFIWTGTHQFNALTTFNNNINFLGTARTITADSAFNITPSGDLYLAPIENVPLTRQIRVRNTIPINSDNFQDLVTGIDGLHFWQPTDGVNQWQLNINAIKADQLFVRVFTVDETRLARGQEYWSKSFGIVETSFNLPADEATVDVWFEDVPDLPINAPLFDAGDWLQIRTIDIAAGYPAITVWFTVVDADATGTNDWILREDAVAPTATNNGHGPRQKWRLKRENGGATGLLIRKGVVVLDAGTPGTAWIHLNALTGNLGSSGPYIQMGIMDSIAASDVPVHKNRIRIGNLKDVAGFASTVYGIAAGNDLSMDPDDGLFRGFTLEDASGLKLYNTDIYLFEGSLIDLSLTSEKGLRLKQDISELGNERRTISWHDNPSTDDDPISFITSWTTGGANIFSILADSKGAATEATLQLTARQPTGSALIRLYSGDQAGAEPGGQIYMIAPNTTMWTNLFLFASPPGTSSLSAVLRVAQNNAVTGAGAGILIEQQDTTNQGDAVLRWWLSSPNKYYSMGIDNDDSDKFKITRGPSLASPAIFTYDPISNTVTIPGISGGGGGTGVVSLEEGEGIAIVGTDPATISVNADIARSNIQIIAGAGLGGGGDLTANRTININPGLGLEIGAVDTVQINLHATAPGLNLTAGLQLDATVAGDGLEFVGTTRVMQTSLGNGLIFTGTTPARDVTIKLRSITTTSSGLIVDTDGLYIRRRGDNGSESGLSMNTAEGLYIADAVAGDGLEWTTTTERILQVSLGIGLEFTGTNRDVRIKAPPNSGLLRDDTGVYLNPTLAGDGLVMLPGTGVIDIVPSTTGGLSVTADNISVKRRTISPGSGLNTSADGLFLQRRGSLGTESGISMTAADGIWLADTVAGNGLEWSDATNRFLQVGAGGGIVVTTNDVAVDLDFNYPWTGNHTFDSASLFRVDSVAQFNNNVNFMGARTVTSSGNLTFTPTGNMVLSPTGSLTLDPGTNVLLPQAQTFQTVVATDNPTGIRGVTIFERSDIANYRQMTIGAFKADELYVRVFVADETRIDRGEEYWSKGFGVVEEDTPALPAVGATFDVWFENAVSFTGNIFGPDDWLMFRAIDFPGGGLLVQAIWCQATTFLLSEAASSTPGSEHPARQRWRLTRRQGGTTGQKIKRGNVALNMGLSGQGAVHLSALVQDNGPFIQFGSWRGTNPYTPFTGEDEPFTNYVRIGKLTGTVDYGSTVAWGLVTGNNVGATPEGGFSGLTADNLQGLRLFNTAINLYAGTNKVITLNQTQGLVLEFGATSSTPTARIDWVSDVDNRNAEIAAGHYAGIEVHSGPTFTTMGIVASDVTGTGALSLGAYSSDGTVSLTMSHNFIEYTGGGSYWRSRAGRFQIGGSDTLATASPLHVYESTTSATGVGAATGITIEQAGTGDALLHFLLTGGRRWMLGIDNSNSVDAFVITSTANLSTTPDLRLLPGGELQIEKLFTTSGMRIQPSAMIGDTTNYPDSVLHIYEATGAVGKTAGLTIDQAGSGDAVLQFRVSVLGTPANDIQRYVMGIDNSDGDKLKITYSVDLASNPIFVYDPATDGVGIGRTPGSGLKLHVNGTTMTPTIQGTTANNGNIIIEGTSSGVKTSSYILLQPTGGLVGVGTLTPFSLFTVSADGASSTISAASYGATFAAQLLLYSANGTEAVPLPTVSGDLIGQIVFQGWDTARSTGASIRATASANWGTAGSGTDDPTNLSFWTVPDGSQTQFERLTILSSGNVGIQNSAPAFVLDVNGTLNAAGAVTFGSSLAITGALTGVTTLTAATITANTSFVSNTLAARTAVGLSITDDGSTLGIFIDDGGGVAVGTGVVPAGVQLYVGGLGVIRALTDMRAPLFRAVSSTGLRIEDDGGNLGIEVADGGAVTVAGSLTATTLVISNVVRARTSAGLRLENDGGALGILVADDGFIGINNASPTFPLHISDTRGSGTGSIVFGANVSSSYTLVFGLDDTGFKMGHNSSSRNLEFQTANLTRMTIGGTGNVGVGTSTLTAKFNIEDTLGSQEHLWIRSNGNAPTIHLRRANASGGTVAGDVIGQIAASGRYDSSSFSQAARGFIRFVAKANWSSTSQDTGILFLVTSGSTPVTAAVLEIFPNGTISSTGTYGNALTAGGNQIKPAMIDVNGLLGTYNLYNYTTGTPREAVYVSSGGFLGVAVSSIRYKTAVEVLAGEAMERLVSALRPVSYHEIADANKTTQYGLIAEEVDAIEGSKPLVYYDNDGTPRNLAYERFIVPLIATVQRLMRRVSELENKDRRLI